MFKSTDEDDVASSIPHRNLAKRALYGEADLEHRCRGYKLAEKSAFEIADHDRCIGLANHLKFIALRILSSVQPPSSAEQIGLAPFPQKMKVNSIENNFGAGRIAPYEIDYRSRHIHPVKKRKFDFWPRIENRGSK